MQTFTLAYQTTHWPLASFYPSESGQNKPNLPQDKASTDSRPGIL